MTAQTQSQSQLEPGESQPELAGGWLIQRFFCFRPRFGRKQLSGGHRVTTCNNKSQKIKMKPRLHSHRLPWLWLSSKLRGSFALH